MLGLRTNVTSAIPASTSRRSRVNRHATTVPAATSGTTWPTLTACMTHQGARAPTTAIQRPQPVLTPAQANATANMARMNTAHTTYASPYGSVTRGAVTNATVGGLRNGWAICPGDSSFCATATSHWL